MDSGTISDCALLANPGGMVMVTPVPWLGGTVVKLQAAVLKRNRLRINRVRNFMMSSRYLYAARANLVSQNPDAFDLQFDHIPRLQPGTLPARQLQKTSGADCTGADHITRLKLHSIRG